MTIEQTYNRTEIDITLWYIPSPRFTLIILLSKFVRTLIRAEYLRKKRSYKAVEQEFHFKLYADEAKITYLQILVLL